MSDDKLNKQSAPPPLLLMGASQGLTLDPPESSNLLLAVPQTDASLFPTDGGEEDNFIGQTDTGGQQQFNYFQQSARGSDPFASVGQQPPSAPVAQSFASQSVTSLPQPSTIQSVSPAFGAVQSLSSGLSGPPVAPPVAAIAPLTSAGVQQQVTVRPQGLPPPAGASMNFHRQKGPIRYAPPPVGTYAASAESLHMTPPHQTASLPPPHASHQPPGIGAFGQHLPPSMSDSVIPTSGLGMVNEDRTSQFVHNIPQYTDVQQTSVNVMTPDSAGEGPTPAYITYIPVQHHWFYAKNMQLRKQWFPFSIIDSNKLEQAFRSGELDSTLVSTDGGRYDVDVLKRQRHAVYWEQPSTEVRRCSWFYRPEGENRFVPYQENFADKLEEEYKIAVTTNVWHKKLEYQDGETIVMHNPNVIVNFTAAAQPDQWGNSTNESYRPRVVKRGVEEAFDDLVEGESSQIDHIVFVVHGIGSTCDLRFRNIVECVDDFRNISMQMLKSHFRQHQEEGRIGRVEYLPVLWHSALHGDATGVDRKLKSITLNSIGKLRHFTNDTLLDILFYSSPAYAQQIADTVGREMNRLYSLFKERNPQFTGGSSVTGHSLGSLIMFDLLVHQKDSEQDDTVELSMKKVDSGFISEQIDAAINQNVSASTGESTPTTQTGSVEDLDSDDVESIEELLSKLGLSSFQSVFDKEHVDLETLKICSDADIKEMGLPLGPRKKLANFISTAKERKKKQQEELAAKLKREAEIQAAEQRQQQQQKEEEQELAQEITDHSLLPSASGTSVNYVVGVAGTGIPFVKYPQLRFQPSHFFALGSPVAMFLTVRGVEFLGEDFRFPTCNSFFNIFHPFDPVAYRLEPMIVLSYPPKPVLMPHHMGRKRLHLELKESIARMGSDIKHKIIQSMKATWKTINDFAAAHRATAEAEVEKEMNSVLKEMTESQTDDHTDTESITSSIQDDDLLVGNINQGRRIDYVLQEKPIESFNDYLFALGSHSCYWESEDTALMLLKEIYSVYGFTPSRPGKPLSHAPGRESQTAASVMPQASAATDCAPPPPLSGFVPRKM